ncbi:hypothetical protein EJB05_47087 [Eragrostis curvula]|uniref:Uncharacterized protein n=1 Tax=Eragrostis curvula TaxID=38414 RepID=A0A5J9T7U0_9POAL|nr:hypothetical protein EJB05_47087 [Eragrostis curvula]
MERSGNIGCVFGSDSPAEQTCQQSKDELSRRSACVVSRLSADEICREPSRDELPSEQGLTLYCGPVTLYHIIQERAKQNPTFIRRGLRYKIHAKQRKRIQITLSLSANTNAELQAQNIFPLYALFARSISDVLAEGHSPLYQFNQACLLTSFNESGSSNHTEAKFTIPDLATLATSRACNRDIILVSCGHFGQTLNGINCSEDYAENSSLQKLEGKCFWGKIPVSLLRSSLDNCMDLILGRTIEFASTIVMSPSFMEVVSVLLGAIFSKFSFTYQSESTMLIASVVTEDFTCSICLMKCGNFKGLESHLLASHDLFNVEFKLSEKKQVVNVRLKHHIRTNEFFPEKVDPRHGTFSYFSKYKKRGRLVAGTEMIVSSKAIEMIVPSETNDVVKHGQLVSLGSKPADFEDGHVQKDNGIYVPDVSLALADSLHSGSISPPKVLQFGKTRKLSVDQFDPRNRELLQKRQIFHSHQGQKMSIEEVLSDHDSEDEIDDDVVDLEERVVLDTYSDIAEDEKRIMRMWNSFARRQRVLADGHIPWVCKAFSELHGQLFVQSPSLRWCWCLFMIKLWNHNLLDACTMNICNMIIDGLKSKGVPNKNACH